MGQWQRVFSGYRPEVLFQILFYLLVFIFYSYDRTNPAIHGFQVVFFLNYILATLILTYIIFPKYLYQKKYWKFAIGVILLIAMVVVVEELIVEKIFFPETRGRIFGLWGLLDIVPTLAIMASFKVGWDIIKKQQEVEELKVSMNRNELNFLRSQINPHFLFNNLNNLYSYALENSPKTPVIILELSSVLRYMLYECSDQFVPLQNELTQLENFVKLNELQIEDRGTIRFEAPKIEDATIKIAPLLMMVFVENAFKHSSASLARDISIDIKVELDANNTLHFWCINNFNSTTNNEDLSKGIGLENVKKRLQITYPTTHTLDIKEDANEFSVHLTIQLADQ